ncbi:hypothetical protein LTR53_002923 [Teratosphaeriaceae sp. CCFEE 6253]|nr:hypothetical protein LTR53_002923 [Teratosphaeriaceae sp. CCFEE 6253]
MDQQTAGDYVVRFIATALTASGAYGLINPLEMNKLFGVPNATVETARMYPGIGGRNLAAGIAVFALSFADERRAVGILLMAWGIVVGPSDTSICLKTKQKRADRLINTVVVTTTGCLATQDFVGRTGGLIWAAGGVLAASVAKTILT